MADLTKEILALGNTVIKKVRLSNAMGAPLALVVLISVPSLLIAWADQFWWLLILACAPVLYFIYAFDYMMKHNPNMLRTEEHEERMLQLQIGMGTKERELSEEEIQQLPAVTPADAALTSKEVDDAKDE
jgi:hypothetical protein